jgi:hypothetical protein
MFVAFRCSAKFKKCSNYERVRDIYELIATIRHKRTKFSLFFTVIEALKLGYASNHKRVLDHYEICLLRYEKVRSLRTKQGTGASMKSKRQMTVTMVLIISN